MHLIEVAPCVSPTRNFDELGYTGLGIGLVEIVEAGVTVGMKEAVTRLQQCASMLALRSGE